MNNPFRGTMNVKQGVFFHPNTWHRPEMWTLIFVVKGTSPIGYDPTITSANDGKHCENSYHYTGWALDFRTRDFVQNLARWITQLKKKLGDRYYVLFESDHLHIHYKA